MYRLSRADLDIVSDNGSTRCTNETNVKEFRSNFGFDHSDMDDSQITALRDFLYDNKDIFVSNFYFQFLCRFYFNS
jgi:hypothetical protein